MLSHVSSSRKWTRSSAISFCNFRYGISQNCAALVYPQAPLFLLASDTLPSFQITKSNLLRTSFKTSEPLIVRIATLVSFALQGRLGDERQRRWKQPSHCSHQLLVLSLELWPGQNPFNIGLRTSKSSLEFIC